MYVLNSWCTLLYMMTYVLSDVCAEQVYVLSGVCAEQLYVQCNLSAEQVYVLSDVCAEQDTGVCPVRCMC